MYYPPTSEASKGGSKFNRKKKSPLYDVKEFVRLSVINFDPDCLGTGKTDWAKKKFGHI